MRVVSLLLLWLTLSAFSNQPLDERQAQDALPKSHDQMWAKLAKTKINVDEKNGVYKAVFPPEIKALVGKEMTISGFMLPLEPTESFRHFIISKRTPTCPFCPPGEPNEIVDVWVSQPVKWDEAIVTVKGSFSLMNNEELGLFFKLSKAKLL